MKVSATVVALLLSGCIAATENQFSPTKQHRDAASEVNDDSDSAASKTEIQSAVLRFLESTDIEAFQGLVDSVKPVPKQHEDDAVPVPTPLKAANRQPVLTHRDLQFLFPGGGCTSTACCSGTFCAPIAPRPSPPSRPTRPSPRPPSRPTRPTPPSRPTRPSPTPPSRPRTPPFHFVVENKCRETVHFSLWYLEEDTQKWTGLCSWTIKPYDSGVLTIKDVRVDTYNTIAYFFAESAHYSWNGLRSSGSIYRTCGNRSLHFKKWTYISNNDFFLSLTCRTSNRRLGSSATSAEETDNEDGEEEVVLEFTPNAGCWSEEGMLIDDDPDQRPCVEGELPVEEQKISAALKPLNHLELDTGKEP